MPSTVPTPAAAVAARQAWRLLPLAAALLLAWPASQAAGLKLNPSSSSEASEPVTLLADRVRTQLDGLTVAEGQVDLRQGGLRLSTDLLELSQAQRLATARGQVRVEQDGNEIRGSAGQLQIDTREGSVDNAIYRFARTGSGGKAQRIEFTGSQRVAAERASYTSCRIDDPDSADWVLKADRLSLDFEHNDGLAEGAVLHFLGVPILAIPVLSFAATGDRKSGWLPPTIYPFDSRNGFEAELPYYFNLAPDHDLTLTPGLLTRRGLSLAGELRYLEARDEGRLAAHWLPDDRAAGSSRYALHLEHQGEAGGGLRYSASVQHASDDDYWKDFARVLPSLTPRLLAQDLRLSQRLLGQVGEDEGIEAYARVLGWRTLQVSDAAILPPYQRAPQVGLRGQGRVGPGWVWSAETEFNRFVLRDGITASDTRPNGQRAHLLGALAWPLERTWGWLTPRLSVNAAAYETDQPMSDGRSRASRVVPTLSLDTGLRFERPTTLFGRALQQTLEPRLHYVRTPWRKQDTLPNFDASVNDFNELSIYGDNAFSGIDYVTDVHQVTLGASSRWFDARGGAELLRLGLAQRYLFSDQRITTDRLTAAGLSAEGPAPATRFSDLLLFGTSTVVPQWRFDANLQYSPDQGHTTRSIAAVRWQPEAFHTLSATYRYTRNLSEQMEVGWQWPIYRGSGGGEGRCSGTLYGVGRVNYGLRERRITDGLAGFEYDAGCWIGRVIAERVSTGRTEATTRLMVQLELVGLSRLGQSPLKALKENIPGYRLLRDDTTTSPTAP